MRLVVASLIAHGSLVAGAAMLAGCNDTFHFDEPGAPDSGTDAAPPDAGPPRERCTNDSACGALRCDTSSGECVSCLTNAHCSGELARCDTALHVCVACLVTTDCASKQRCDETTRRCLDTCFDDDDPCPQSGFICDPTHRLCVECRSSANCAGSASGTVCDVPIGRCVECNGNAQCPAEKPACDLRTGRCVGCVTSSACGLGLACDPVTLVCRAP